MTKIDTKELRRHLIYLANKIIKPFDCNKFRDLCDAYDEAQKEIESKTQDLFAQSTKSANRIFRLEVLLHEVLAGLGYSKNFKAYSHNTNEWFTLKICPVCHNSDDSLFAHTDLCIFTRIQKELGEK